MRAIITVSGFTPAASATFCTVASSHSSEVEDRPKEIGIADALAQVVHPAAGQGKKAGQQIFIGDDNRQGLERQSLSGLASKGRRFLWHHPR